MVLYPPDIPWRCRPDDPEGANPTPGFSLNWSCAENCDANVKPEAGVCTFMGMPTSRRSGYGLEFPDDETNTKKAAVEIMKKHGYRCETPPEGWEPEDEDLEEGREEEQFFEKYNETIEVMGKTTNNVEFELECDFGWLYIRCNSPEAKAFVEKYIRDTPHYQLGLIEHDEQRFELDHKVPEVTLVQRTGGQHRERSKIGTLFELHHGSKTIAKALCSYRNTQTWSAGPTIVRFEVAGELRRKGYGTLLLEEVTAYFEEVFLVECKFPKPIKYNVCHCCSRHGYDFFMSQNFEDLDGIGEELGKNLGDW